MAQNYPIHFARVTLVLAVWTLVSGCEVVQVIDPIAVQLIDSLDESVAQVHHELIAEFAWLRWSGLFQDQPHHLDFASGFRSAYVDVINGGSGESPVLPPKRYWRRFYENAWGRGKAEAWFTGYAYGAIAAEQDGAGNWYELPLSLLPEEHFPAEGVLPPPFDDQVIETLSEPETETESAQEASPDAIEDVEPAPAIEMAPPIDDAEPAPSVEIVPPLEDPPLPEFKPPATEEAPPSTSEENNLLDLEGIPFPPREPSTDP